MMERLSNFARRLNQMWAAAFEFAKGIAIQSNDYFFTLPLAQIHHISL